MIDELDTYLKKYLIVLAKNDGINVNNRTLQSIHSEVLGSSSSTKNQFRYISFMEEFCKSRGFKPLGAGSFKKVYAISNDMVLKIPGKTEQLYTTIKLNKQETDNAMSTKFSEVMPKIYERGYDYSWYVSERLRPLSVFQIDFDDIENFLNRYKFNLSLLNMKGLNEETNLFMFVLKYVDFLKNLRKGQYSQEDEVKYKLCWLDKNLNIQSTWTFMGVRPKVEFFQKFESLVLSKPFIKQALNISEEFNISIWDLRPENLGIPMDGTPVIKFLDVSILDQIEFLGKHQTPNKCSKYFPREGIPTNEEYQ